VLPSSFDLYQRLVAFLKPGQERSFLLPALGANGNVRKETVLAVGLTKTVEASHAEPSPNELDRPAQICAIGRVPA